MAANKTAGQVAREFYLQGYTCAESAWLALTTDLPEADRNFGLKLAGALSGGCGNGTLCGAVAGSLMAIGRWHGRTMGEPRNPALAETVKKVTDAFKAKYGALDCASLKRPVENYREFCAEMVEFVVNVADQALDAGDDGDCG